ncbi:MAG TPA: hypothetical protein VHA11_03615, partial [Bryobacteraceae bacterium]|nr:hypothetical protein [Bryobacteraceae bacterium]
MENGTAAVRPDQAAMAEAAIRKFLDVARQPVLLEPGQNSFPLNETTCSLEWRGQRFVLQVWDET